MRKVIECLRKRPIIGHTSPITNLGRSWRENRHYVRVPVVENGKRCHLLLTFQEFSQARLRAERNTEDCPLPRGILGFLLWPILRRR